MEGVHKGLKTTLHKRIRWLWVFDGYLLGMVVCSLLALGYLIDNQRRLIRLIEKNSMDLILRLENIDPKGGGFVEDLKDSMADIVEDTLASMAPPAASDHVAGALAQIAQMWAFKRFGNPQEMIQNALGQGEPPHE